MSAIPPDRRAAFRALIERFLKEVRDSKQEKMDPDSSKYAEITAKYMPDVWLADAAHRISQIQATTHPVKATYPDAKIREVTSLFVNQEILPQCPEIGSHTIRTMHMDVTGNAAVLDVYKFLRQEIFGQSLLDWLMAEDKDLLAALNDKPELATLWAAAFAGLIGPRCAPTTHTRAKQLYWLVGDDPLEDGHYHLLAPLYASSLAHEVYQTINEERFGEAATAARQARREQRDHPHGFAEYRDLAVQKLGGTKPQNISQLNSERGGNSYLLASLPPNWQSRAATDLRRIDSAFARFSRRPGVREGVEALRGFLDSDPPPTVETRNRRVALFDSLIDELVAFAGEIQEGRTAGWSAAPDCRLVREEQLWLDPGRVDLDEDFRKDWCWMDWTAEIGKRFGNWLNARLEGKLPVGEVEARHWQKELLIDERADGWAHSLHDLRRQNGTPTHIPTREAAR